MAVKKVLVIEAKFAIEAEIKVSFIVLNYLSVLLTLLCPALDRHFHFSQNILPIDFIIKSSICVRERVSDQILWRKQKLWERELKEENVFFSAVAILFRN